MSFPVQPNLPLSPSSITLLYSFFFSLLVVVFCNHAAAQVPFHIPQQEPAPNGLLPTTQQPCHHMPCNQAPGRQAWISINMPSPETPSCPKRAPSTSCRTPTTSRGRRWDKTWRSSSTRAPFMRPFANCRFSRSTSWCPRQNGAELTPCWRS